MQTVNSEGTGHRRGGIPADRLEDLIPIAVVVAAGCKSCTQTLVQRALERGSAKQVVGRTLAIIANVRSRECFARAVGPEVIARMAGPLEAGKKALVAPAARPERCLES